MEDGRRAALRAFNLDHHKGFVIFRQGTLGELLQIT